MTRTLETLIERPIRQGLVNAEGWYEAEVVEVEPVVLYNGSTKIRFCFLLDDGHLAYLSANLSQDPKSKLATIWRLLSGGEEPMVMARMVGKRCRVHVKRANKTNVITEIHKEGEGTDEQ